VSGSWWLVLLLVGLMPWPAGRVATEVAARPDYASAIPLTTLAVLSWLFFRACTTLHDVWCYVEILHLEGRLRPSNDAIQIVVVDLVSTALLAPPLWRVHEFRRQRARRQVHTDGWSMAVRQLTLAAWSTIVAALRGWILFFDAPLAEYHAFRTLAALPGPAWTIDYDAGAKTLTLTGEYQYGVAAAFTAALARYPHTRTVELHGPGGRQYEALAIARAIETRGLTTRVSNKCASAIIATMALCSRRLRSKALIGVARE